MSIIDEPAWELDDVPWDGYYDEDGRHRCSCDELTRYQVFSGGLEFYCEHCEVDGTYPEGDGGPRAWLLVRGPDGIAELRQQLGQD